MVVLPLGAILFHPWRNSIWFCVLMLLVSSRRVWNGNLERWRQSGVVNTVTKNKKQRCMRIEVRIERACFRRCTERAGGIVFFFSGRTYPNGLCTDTPLISTFSIHMFRLSMELFIDFRVWNRFWRSLWMELFIDFRVRNRFWWRKRLIDLKKSKL